MEKEKKEEEMTSEKHSTTWKRSSKYTETGGKAKRGRRGKKYE